MGDDPASVMGDAVAELAGVNCRHRIYPYVPGESVIPGTSAEEVASYEKKYGMTSEEYYRQTQRQRSLERELRAAKREAAFLEDEGLDATSQRYRIGDLQAKLREHCRSTGLERDPTRERAYGVSHQPRGLKRPEPALSSSARNQATRAEKTKAAAGDLKTEEAIAVRDSRHLQRVLGPERTADIARGIEESMRSGDKTRKNAARVYAAGVRDGSIVYSKSKKTTRPAYYPASGKVRLRAEDVSSRTAVHEGIHARDFQQSIPLDDQGRTSGRYLWNSNAFQSSRGTIRDALERDYQSLRESAESTGRSVEEVVGEALVSKGLRRTYSSAGFLSDMIEAASHGAEQLGYGGHIADDPNYWRSRGGRYIPVEALADYSGAAAMNPLEYEVMRDLFEDASVAMDELLEVMSNAQEGQIQ